jgi:hypothetical protein
MSRKTLALKVLIVLVVVYMITIAIIEANADSATGTVNGPVRLIFNTGRTITYADTTVTSYSGSVFGTSPVTQTTGADGSTSYNLTYGLQYGVWARLAGVFNVTFTLTPNEQDYYVIITSATTCSVVPASQINVAYPLHSVGVTFNQWAFWNIGPDADVAVYLNGEAVTTNQTTDDVGHVAFQLYGGVKYNMLVTRNSDGLAKWFNRTFDGSSYGLDVTGYFNKGGVVNNATSSGSSTIGNPDEDITTSVTPSKGTGSGDLLCNYTDVSGATTSVTINVYQRNTTDPANKTLLATETFPSNCSIVYNYHISSDPTGMDYYVEFAATYTDAGGNSATIERSYLVSYHGPLRVIPGWPADWYKYLSWVAIIIVGAVIGKFGIEEGAVTIAAMFTVFCCLDWFYEFGDSYQQTVMAIMWVGAVGLVWLKREREGRM